MLNEERIPVSWRELRAAWEFLGVSLDDVWVAYFSVGGCATGATVGRWLEGETEIPHLDHNYLAVALNEMFLDRDLGQPVRCVERLDDGDL